MQSQKVFLTAIALAAYAASGAQGNQFENQAPVKSKIKISSVSVQQGLEIQGNQFGTISDFQNLAPNSTLLNHNFSGYSQPGIGPGNYSMITAGGLFGVSLGIKFADKERNEYRSNPELRIGFSHFSGTNLTGNAYKTTQFPYDTLVSTRTGQVTYIDSVKSSSYNMNYSSEQIRIDVSLIFRTNPEARWSLYGGIGLAAGLQYNCVTTIYHSNSNYTSTTDSPSGYYDNGIWPGDSETIKNQNGYSILASVPLGIDFRMGSKREFWKRLHLFYEFKPMVNLASSPELGMRTSTGLQTILGLKVAVD